MTERTHGYTIPRRVVSELKQIQRQYVSEGQLDTSFGAQGIIYKARDIETHQLVARKDVRFSPRYRRFVDRELMNLLEIGSYHQNLITLIEGACTDDMMTLVFPFHPTDLCGVLANRSICLSACHIKGILQQILTGLQALHSINIIHRDIKPDNILITAEGVVKIADFGSSKMLSEWETEEHSLQRVALWYRAPEILLGSTNYTAKVDIWSLGCVFADMHTRCPAMRPLHQIGGLSDQVTSESEGEVFAQLETIFQVCGKPSDWSYYWGNLPNVHYLYGLSVNPHPTERFGGLKSIARCFLGCMLEPIEARRSSASALLRHRFFRTEPLPCAIEKLSHMESADRQTKSDWLTEIPRQPRAESTGWSDEDFYHEQYPRSYPQNARGRPLQSPQSSIYDQYLPVRSSGSLPHNAQSEEQSQRRNGLHDSMRVHLCGHTPGPDLTSNSDGSTSSAEMETGDVPSDSEMVEAPDIVGPQLPQSPQFSLYSSRVLVPIDSFTESELTSAAIENTTGSSSLRIENNVPPRTNSRQSGAPFPDRVFASGGDDKYYPGTVIHKHAGHGDPCLQSENISGGIIRHTDSTLTVQWDEKSGLYYEPVIVGGQDVRSMVLEVGDIIRFYDSPKDCIIKGFGFTDDSHKNGRNGVDHLGHDLVYVSHGKDMESERRYIADIVLDEATLINLNLEFYRPLESTT